MKTYVRASKVLHFRVHMSPLETPPCPDMLGGNWLTKPMYNKLACFCVSYVRARAFARACLCERQRECVYDVYVCVYCFSSFMYLFIKTCQNKYCYCASCTTLFLPNFYFPRQPAAFFLAYFPSVSAGFIQTKPKTI